MVNALRIGTFALSAQFPGQGHAEALHRTVRTAEVAEEAGLDSVWLAEHHFVPYGVCPSAVTLAALLLGRTRRINIGTAVSVLPTTHPVETGARVRVGACELEVIEVVGHTPGSIVLAYDDPDGSVHLFTGDSLFPGGVGKTWSPEDFETLIGEVEAKIFGRFPDDTRFYPGHGNDSTLGAERPHLGEWRERGW